MTIEIMARDYEAATNEFLAAVASVAPSLYDRRVTGGWSTRQVIHHVADSETPSYARLRRLIAEPAGAIIQGYDEALWASSPLLGYEELPVEHPLAVFRAVRQASLDVLRRLRESDLGRTGVHSRIRTLQRAHLDRYLRTPPQ